MGFHPLPVFHFVQYLGHNENGPALYPITQDNTTLNTTPITTFSRCAFPGKSVDCNRRGNPADMNTEHDTRTKKASTGSDCCFMEIRVKGQLSDQWRDWFENLEIRLLENGEMLLSGAIPDQAALMGILNKLNRLNLTLLSVNEVNRNQEQT